jgi:hypothetical protein
LRLIILLTVIVITAVITLFSVLRTPSFQVLAGRLAAGFLTRQFNSEIYLDKLTITQSLFINISGFQVNDHISQCMLYVDDLRIKIDWFSLREHSIRFKNVSLDGGGFFLEKYDGDSLLNVDVFLRGFQSDTLQEKDTLPGKEWSIYCSELLVNDLSFGLKQFREEYETDMIDFNNLKLSGLFLDMKEISVIGDSIAGFVEHIAFREQSGFELLNFSGDLKVSRTGISLQGGQVSTGQTSLDLDLAFSYDDYGKLSSFLDSVYIQTTIRNSLITLSDIGYFAPVMYNMEDPVMFSARIEGTISDFNASELKFNVGDFTEFDGTISIRGIPDIDSTSFHLQIDKLVTTPEDISAFNLPLEKPNVNLPAQLKEMGFTTIRGSFNGLLSDFTVSLDVKSDAGDVIIKGGMSADADRAGATFSGDILGKSIQLGNLIGSEELGTVNLELEFNGHGSAIDKLNVAANGWVENLEFKQYKYEKIIFGGTVDGKSFDGRVVVTDSSINLGFNGLVDFNGAQPVFNFLLDIQNARFYDLNLSDRSKDMILSGKVRGNFTGSSADSFYGSVLINDLSYLENGTNYALQNFSLKRRSNLVIPDSTTLRSDFIDGDITGNFRLATLVNHFTWFILGKHEDPAVRGEMERDPQLVNFDFQLKDITPVTELFVPWMMISPGTNISGNFDSGKQKLELKGETGEVKISGVQFTGISFSGETNPEEFVFELGIDHLLLRDTTDGPSIYLENIMLHTVTQDSSLNFKLLWDNKSTDAPNYGSLDGFFHYYSANHFEAGLFKAEANLAGDLWYVEKSNLFTYDSTRIGLRNFKIYNEKESFTIDGNLSSLPEDTLNIYFHDWALENFNPLLEKLSLEMEGVINGRLGLFRSDGKANVFAGIYIDDLSLNKVYFGDAGFKTRWLENQKALAVDLNIFSKGTMEKPYKILDASGNYYPFDEKQNFDFTINAKNLNISVLEPLLSSFSSHLAGLATGKLTLEGTNEKPVLQGRLKLQRAEMLVDYLNVTYSFANEVVFKEDMIQFGELKVYDPNSNTAKVSGGIRHNYFKDMSLDLTIEPVNFMAINLDRYQNDVFYGTAYTTGVVKLTGPFQNLSIAVDVATDNNTQVSIPINYSVDVSQNNFIIFTSTKDSLEKIDEKEKQIVGLNLDIAMRITRNADIEIFLPGNLGYLRARGDGKLRLGVDPYGYLTLNGSYVIQNGLFVFSLEQLVSRRFDIMEGSNISWSGDISNAEVSIIARYRLRTDLSGLGITLIDPEASSQKVIVNTDIRMTGNLFNPDLSFGITFPNMEEQTRQAVYAVLDTNDRGLMNQQAISLLVLGSFSSTGTGGTNPVNPAAIVSSTLSNMLSQISNDFNIGINYMPGDQVSAEQLEVALSTQLLDDRLIIDGNFDVSGSDASSQKTSSIVGDINVEYKLTPDGRFRVKAFNRSNDLSLFDDDSPYTQGVGVFYRKDFNNFREMFRKAGKTSAKTK